MSEALIFASTNPQYDDRLFIELQVQYMKFSSSNLGKTCCVQNLFLAFRSIFVHNMFSPYSAKRKSFWQRFTCTYLDLKNSKVQFFSIKVLGLFWDIIITSCGRQIEGQNAPFCGTVGYIISCASTLWFPRLKGNEGGEGTFCERDIIWLFCSYVYDDSDSIHSELELKI